LDTHTLYNNNIKQAENQLFKTFKVWYHVDMRTGAIIHLNRFKENIDTVKARIGQKTRICVPVKADAYGHGALQISKTAMEAGVYCLGTATVAEGIELRKGGIQAPILLFSQPHPDEIPLIIKAKLIPFISDEEYASALNKQAAAEKIKLPVHLKIDTGMGRIGCSVNEALSLAQIIKKCPSLVLAGTATHLAVSDSADRKDIDFTNTQLSRFKKAVTAIKNSGINPGIVHAANSGAVILHPNAWLDMVRPGILLYGFKAVQEYEAPVDHLRKISKLSSIIVKPVMELKSAVSLIKKIKTGDSVSYGRTWTANESTTIGVLSIGYADGLPRMASNKWQVVINGGVYPLVGRITMDQCCVDLGQKPNVKRWDEAIIFGDDVCHEQPLTANEQRDVTLQNAAELASVVRTIPYEITCNISKRVPRIYKH
jgi:alanine racemase